MAIEEAFAQNMVPVVAIVGGMLFVLGMIWVNSWRHVTVARQQAALKEQLLAKGMSPDEIVKVVNAGQVKAC
jgi:hypothetical protein